ncbi:MAG: 3-hydroxyacyl-CoA dehydrogenase NAD-binding domain-containing protein, partial [Dehalococcoidia bacterium]|nr:3-hydroxyacyl-CoA dehydrogenase NAD-binding domain-containing protein [Dehalococcoidia bacterium]
MSIAIENWLKKVQTITIIGAGTMGHGFAHVFSLGGYDVMLSDIDEKVLEKAKARITASLDTFVENGLTTVKVKQEAISRIKTTTDRFAAVRKAQFVLEAAPEILSLKQK